MNKSVFGRIITKYREKYSLNQITICEGICPKSVYHRAELEERAVEFVVQETLLARVGVDATNFEVVLDDVEFEQWSRRLAICAAMREKQYDVVEEKVRDYRAANAEKHKLHEQFCLYYEMKLAMWREENVQEVCNLAEKALLLTKDISKQPEIKKNLYTPMEIDLLLTLIQYTHPVWRSPWKRGECLVRITEYVGVYFKLERQEEIEGKAWIELLELEEKFGEIEPLLTYIEHAIECFVEGSSLLPLAKVRFIKAKLLYKISISAEDAVEKRELCKAECEMAYCIYDVMEHESEREEVARFCKEELQWHITMQMK